MTSAGYRVTAAFSAQAGVKEILMPTWTQAGGQDDLIWHKASVSKNTATFYIPVSGHHGESGTYITHIYVWDQKGSYALKGVNVQVPKTQQTPSAAPEIKEAAVTELSSSGYRVTVQFTAAAGVKEVLMPTWTQSGGQDDLIWHQAEINGSTATFYVPITSHKNEHGAYITHIYVKDNNGRQALKGVQATVPVSGSQISSAAPDITEVKATEVTASGYRVTVSFESSAGIKEVLMPTWTAQNGQDDRMCYRTR